jgi:hypothetical protein
MPLLRVGCRGWLSTLCTADVLARHSKSGPRRHLVHCQCGPVKRLPAMRSVRLTQRPSDGSDGVVLRCLHARLFQEAITAIRGAVPVHVC